MGDLTPIRPRLAALLPRLASESDGEVVATARAIGRQLRRAGADWHALAEAVTAEPRERPVYTEPAPDPYADPRDVVLWLEMRPHRLRPKERAFINDLAAYVRLGTFRPTAKQLNWLDKIHARVMREEGGGDEW